MGLLSTVKYIAGHPLNKKDKAKSVIRFFKWQINTRLNPFPVVYQFTDRSLLIVEKGATGATGNLYCGLHEFYDMGFLLHFLRKGDHFVDIGANVGSYTVLAAAHVGAQTTTFEPVPATFAKLLQNIGVNRIGDIAKPINVALGSTKGFVEFTTTFDTINHIATAADKGNTVSVEVNTLDNILEGERTPILLKIDVEGFETEVINGAKNTLADPGLKGMIIELNNSGARYGYDDALIHKQLLTNGFRPYVYNPFDRKLSEVTTFGDLNTIYIRDFDFVNERLKNAEKVKIGDNIF